MTKSEPEKLSVVKPPLGPIFLRVLTLFSFLVVCAAAACTTWAKGVSWIYDSGNNGQITVLTCPEEIYSFAGTIPVGDYCQLSFVASVPLMTDIVDYGLFASGDCLLPSSAGERVICNVHARCADICRTVDGTRICPAPEQLPPAPLPHMQLQCQMTLGYLDGKAVPLTGTVSCLKVLYGSYCDSSYGITASNSLAIRGIFIGVVVMTLLWLIAEFILRSVDTDLRREKARGMARMSRELPEKRAILRQSLEERWKMLDCTRDVSNLDFDEWTASPASSRPQSLALISDPAKRFESQSWARRLSQWRKLRAEKSTHFKTKMLLRTAGLHLFFIALLYGTFLLVLEISPSNISLSQTWLESLISKLKIWELSTWADYLVFADILVDFGLFLVATIAVKWPKAPVFTRHLQDQMAAVTANRALAKDDASELDYSRDSQDDLESRSSATVSFILNQAMSNDTCLMIACHCSTMTLERRETFSHTLRSAMKVFPPSHIFVCDNGPTMLPQDETQFVARQVHPDINYVYIPEGNKTFAFYWVNRHWIPYLARCGVSQNFTYAVIIDDDVPLPSDLHIPHQHLAADPNIKAVHFPITATTPDGNPPMLVKCQDIEYKLAAVHKLFQAQMSRSLSCHGAIALWDRVAMAEVLQEHDTVFNGEDLYMGLCLLRKRDKSTIISCAQTVVPTYAPDSWGVLFRQRVKSWELTSHKKTFTFLFEIINPVSFFHIPSLCLKPYFIQELLTILLDWLRMFLLMGLVMRDTLSFLFMTAFFTLLLYFQLVLYHFVVLRDRRDLRSSFWTVLTFPFYKFCNLFFRICALCQNMLVYSHERKGIKIAIREDEIRDIPPLPPHHLVDWFTVWNDTPAPVKALSRSRSAVSASTPSRFRS